MTYREKYQQDVKFGFEMEKENFERLKSFLNCDLKQNKRYDIFDYESENHLIELKTRRCNSTTYKDTMIPINKIDFCKTTEKDAYYFFQFNDGLFYWKYSNDDLEKLRFDKGGRVDRSRIEIKQYCYIPYELLVPI